MPVLQDELFRIGQEILRNAFRHAHAKQIEVEIRYSARELRLRIRDDGTGIDSKVLNAGARPGHWGLPGVRERAKLIGAEFDLWSQAAAGTEIQIRVPASLAYLKSRSFDRLRLLRIFMATEGVIRILTVDDHALLRRGIAASGKMGNEGPRRENLPSETSLYSRGEPAWFFVYYEAP